MVKKQQNSDQSIGNVYTGKTLKGLLIVNYPLQQLLIIRILKYRLKEMLQYESDFVRAIKELKSQADKSEPE